MAGWATAIYWVLVPCQVGIASGAAKFLGFDYGFSLERGRQTWEHGKQHRYQPNCATLFWSSNKPQQVNDTNLIAGLIVDVGWKGESFLHRSAALILSILRLYLSILPITKLQNSEFDCWWLAPAVWFAQLFFLCHDLRTGAGWSFRVTPKTSQWLETAEIACANSWQGLVAKSSWCIQNS